MSQHDYRCAACNAVHTPESWGAVGACPACAHTHYSHVDHPAPVSVTNGQSETPATPLGVGAARAAFAIQIPAAVEWQGRAIRAEARAAELEGRLEQIRQAAR